MILRLFVEVWMFFHSAIHVAILVQVLSINFISYETKDNLIEIKAYQSITCLDKYWFCPTMKTGCNAGIINATLTVKSACTYTCGLCTRKYRNNYSLLEQRNIRSLFRKWLTSSIYHNNNNKNCFKWCSISTKSRFSV